MIDSFHWEHFATGLIGVVIGAIGKVFLGGIRVGRIQGALEMKIANSDKRTDEKLRTEIGAFDETLKGLRQKINDVELDVERRFLPKGDFNDFREEYREDMRDIKKLIRSGHE